MPGVDDSPVGQGTSRSAEFHLTSLLAIGASAGFAALLVGLTGDLIAFWPLYLVPILVAALAYHIAGAVLSSAVVLLLVVLTAPQPTLESVGRIGIGLAAAVLCGIIVGAQARRHALHEHELERVSIRDETTGSFTPVYFGNRLAEEVRRCDRYGVGMGVVLVGVNDFETFKTTFGHYKSELLLEHMASIINVCVRDTDIVARFGPEEFAVILPFADEDRSQTAAARIKASVDSAQFEGDALEPVTSVGVVVATAAYPTEANDRSKLLQLLADRLADARASRSNTPGVVEGGASVRAEATLP
ncbi:MAG: GGDEF domain-containing protein [Coriobacteriia bacterium]